MVRTENDSWDLASSVGATATMVAAARALASKQPEPLIDDPFAEPLVRAVGIDFFVKMLDGELDLLDSDDPQFNPIRVIDLLAVRTKFFDDFFLAAAAAGVRQAVILASGLDSRAYRLPWPPGTVVFEIDQPAVVEFKTATLAGHGAKPAAEHRPVAVDLRDDWPAALRAAGFDATRPTAWSAEGLLAYLPPDAQDRLFDNITELSAPASRLATEYHPDGPAAIAQRNEQMARRFSEHGLELDLAKLMYHGERNSAADYLAARGWQISIQLRPELFEKYGRELPTDDVMTAPLRSTIAVTAIRDCGNTNGPN
jgi:methyltransferase (TIGR00027 family)